MFLQNCVTLQTISFINHSVEKDVFRRIQNRSFMLHSNCEDKNELFIIISFITLQTLPLMHHLNLICKKKSWFKYRQSKKLKSSANICFLSLFKNVCSIFNYFVSMIEAVSIIGIGIKHKRVSFRNLLTKTVCDEVLCIRFF